MSQPTLPRLLPLLLLLLLHLLIIIPSAISARPLIQLKSTPSSLKDESPISIDGLCGSHSITTNNKNKTTCLHSPFGDSCSKWGFCGSFYEKEYSGRGCQVDFGVCNSEFATAINDAAESSTTLSTSSSYSSATSFSTSTPGIIIIPITTTFVSVVVSTSGSFNAVQTLTGMVGFCGVAGSNCKM